MIKFFRTIRYQLFSNNKINKYLLYALGEIALVVVGILIALQINIWNEHRKTREIEINLLLELKDDLKETKTDLITDIEKTEQLLVTTNTLYKTIIENGVSNSTPFALPTGFILETAMLFPKLSAYQAIQSEGITIISNHDLRKKITDFYQLHLSRVTAAESFLEALNNEEIKPYLNANSSYGSTCIDCKDLFALYSSNKGAQRNLYKVNSACDNLVHMLKEKFNVLNTLNQRYLALSSTIDEIIFLIEKHVDN